MKIYILGGFLGSGKTTLLMKMADMFINKGKKVSILVNEAGDIGVDGATINSQGYNAVELPNGCICCSMVGTMHESLMKIKSEIAPDILIIEPTGIAFPGKVREAIELIDYGEEFIQIIGIFDGPRFKLFVEKKKDFYKKQLMDSDILVMNKMDLTPDDVKEEAIQWMNKEIPGIEVIPVVATTGENLDKVFSELRE
ncbi:MAG: GTP-binding protein [Methanomassiliicoccales archaeon]|uniref:GTP-binding protein n=1 Tax=Candidatus Methanarcanum hacksteinii TaxID=2911857 RepID=UPI002A78FEC4|nr:GTPase [Candidatus Methanomethylophilaceae archaeon]MCI6025555.1 GTPase [Methanomassiliicoccales archaeon]MDD7479193.1 GTP-binding protein [Methanomassiliicoccales archaeon]MDY4581072.1 GTP-binding protein [Candidatus Methanarcanum hacksteinii]TQS78193.1 MAG: GTPase [Candidatus Methanarcanum hacksteinii]